MRQLQFGARAFSFKLDCTVGNEGCLLGSPFFLLCFIDWRKLIFFYERSLSEANYFC